MSDMVLYIIVLLGAAVLLFVSYFVSSGPNTCPNCKKEYQKSEDWSYGDYSWGSRCPHCKYEFDITP
jgi:transposase-like protein